MEKIAPTYGETTWQCRDVFGTTGRLATAIPGFVARPQQLQMAEAIAKAINEHARLVVEAGTGTGKTFAYLTPCLLSGKKVLISTATKTLQDQLFHKDIPLLMRALGLALQVQNLKGRAHYLCRYRIELYAEEGRFSSPSCAHELLYVQEKLPRLIQGGREELPEIKEDSVVWPYVTSTVENCLGSKCSYHQTCFLVKARKRALEADMVVINHHLYFADSRLKEEGFGELLPGVEIVVFDEAHQLPDIAAAFYDKRLSTRLYRSLVDDTLQEWPVLDLANQPLKKLSRLLDEHIDAFLKVLQPHGERVSWDDVARYPAFVTAWEALLQFSKQFLLCFEAQTLEGQAGLARCKARLETLSEILDAFNLAKKNSASPIQWIECLKHHVVFHATPADVADAFGLLLDKQSSAYIFTSATLTVSQSFQCFEKTLGLFRVNTLLLPSPFDFKSQAMLYLPRGLPDPKRAHYYDILLEKVLPIILACGGRSFFLFTSHRALKYVAACMATLLPFPLLVQGEEAKHLLLARFRQLGNAVLLGTSTFWEGVDVKGDALSCVIIDKLPFLSPTDPVIRGKMRRLSIEGRSGFEELSLTNAVLALKQGVGRLIRDTTDKGILVLADPRLTGRDYGKSIFRSLPSMQKTREEAVVLSFINQLALKNDVVSD